jgi:hypothetical protein
MVLDGVTVLSTSMCLTVMHTGIGFGDEWSGAKFTFRKLMVRKDRDLEEDARKENPGSEGMSGNMFNADQKEPMSQWNQSDMER